ncbi:Long-chain-fatty-acid--CoA ligase [hydrothermal vent metagenome]|uniref:Long-chain-fatty-acid--CoA ligase n=1 Tax=hydrothermal vent metagenome TaxID=652676 RepID=A0A3B1E0B5_9ZZZZ
MRLVLEKAAEQYDQKLAIIFQDEQISFQQLKISAFKLANVLKAQGVGKGDKVAFYLPNCPQYVYSYLASFCLGAVGVPLDFMLKEDELISCLSHSETKVLIAMNKDDVDLKEVNKNVASLEKVILCAEVFEGALSYQDLMAEASEALDEVSIGDKDPSLIMYTSGTTGKPKGILLNYKHLEGSPEAMKHFVDLTDKDIKLAAIPLSHIAGFIYIQNCLCFGITTVLMGRFNPFQFLENIAKYKVTCFHIVPAMYMAMLTLKQIEKYDLSSLRWVVVFGAPSSPEIMERFHKYCPNAKLLNGWGMTETCPPNTVTPLDSDNIASIGKPAPNCEIKIFDEENNTLPANTVGEIVIRGWIIMDEYYKDPEATATMKRDGWLYTGDLGRFDEEGFLYIMGRKKEMIKVSGQLVYAPEVEAAFYKHEGVAEVAVIGVPDELRGEVIKAFVVLKEGESLTPEDLRHFVKEHLANFKVPQSVELQDELPKNRTGKIDKALLKKEVLI